MTFNQYQTAALRTAIYPEQMQMEYPCLGLCGESGEVADKIKKLVRDHNWYPGQPIPEAQRKAIALELGDVMWYVAVLLDRKGWSMSDAMNAFDMSLDQRIDDRVPNLLSYFKKHSYLYEEPADVMAVVLCSLASKYALGTMTKKCSAISVPTAYIVAVVARLAEVTGYSLEEICQMNIEKLQGRVDRGTLHGSGDER